MVVLTLSFVMSIGAAAQGSADSACLATPRARRLCATDSLLAEAIRRNDAQTLQHIYADEYQFTTYRGSLSDKEGQLQAFRTAEMRFDSATVVDRRVRVYECAAVVTGRRHQTATVRGVTRTGDNRFTHVYVWRDRRWQLVASQNTPVLNVPATP